MELTKQQADALLAITKTLEPDPLTPVQQVNKTLQDLSNGLLAERVDRENKTKQALADLAAKLSGEASEREALLQKEREGAEAELRDELAALQAAYDQAKKDINALRLELGETQQAVAEALAE